MRLERLQIRRKLGYGSKPDVLEGSIEYVGDNGAIKVALKDHHIAGLLGVVGDALVEQSREVANNLSTEALNHHLLSSPDPAEQETT